MKYLLTFLIILQNSYATDNNMIRSTFDALTKLKTKPSNHPSAKKRVEVVFTMPDSKRCDFIKKIFITELDYRRLKDKSCTSIIETMRYSKDFKDSDLLYIESIPLNCSPLTFYGQLYSCK